MCTCSTVRNVSNRLVFLVFAFITRRQVYISFTCTFLPAHANGVTCVHAVAGMYPLDKLGFVRQTIRKKQRLPRKHKRKKPQTDRHPKQKPSTSKQNKIRLQTLTDEISLLQDKLTAARDLQKTTLGRYNEKDVSLQASTLENAELESQLALAHETKDLLQADLEEYKIAYYKKNRQILALEDKMSKNSWEHKGLEDLLRIFTESRNDLASLERYMRQKVAKEDLRMTLPMCVCPISKEIVEDPVHPPCNCKCVYERAMLMQLKPPGKCPTCRAEFLPEQVQPAHVLKDVIKALLEVSIRGNTKHSLETLVSSLDAAPVAGGW